MKPSLLVLTLAAGLGLGTTATAGNAGDLLWQTGVLEDVAGGTTLTFAQLRSGPDTGALPAIDGDLTIAVGEGDAATANVSFDQPERRVTLPPQPLSTAHPALLVFLETVRGSLATLSGGSPHYIKNRMIEAFQAPPDSNGTTVTLDGEDVSAERLVFRPFADDPNVTKLGEVAALELTFVVSDAVPGGLYAASATTDTYSESLELERVE